MALDVQARYAWYDEETAVRRTDAVSGRVGAGQAALVILALSLVAWGFILAPFFLI